MIKYKKYQNKNDKSVSFGKWYGRAVHELMEFDEFIEHMAKHHCVYSEGTLRGILIEMEICLREHVKVVLPIVTRELEVFASRLELFDRHGIGVSVMDPETLHVANNKGLLLTAIRDAHLPVPASTMEAFTEELPTS